MKLSFVVPLYNEEKRIEKAVREIAAFREKLPYSNEWIFVDDGSTDATEQLARQALGNTDYRWIQFERNLGKGRAVQRGIMEAQGDVIFFIDADLSTPLVESELLLKALQDGYDIAIGSRSIPGSRVLVHQSWLRERMGKTFNLFARALTFKQIRDSQCGFKAFHREVAHRLFPLQKISGFSFDAEIIYLAQRAGLKVAEIPVTWLNSNDSKVRMVRDSLSMLTDLFRIRWLHRNLNQSKETCGKRN